MNLQVQEKAAPPGLLAGVSQTPYAGGQGAGLHEVEARSPLLKVSDAQLALTARSGSVTRNTKVTGWPTLGASGDTETSWTLIGAFAGGGSHVSCPHSGLPPFRPHATVVAGAGWNLAGSGEVAAPAAAPPPRARVGAGACGAAVAGGAVVGGGVVVVVSSVVDGATKVVVGCLGAWAATSTRRGREPPRIAIWARRAIRDRPARA